MRSHRSAPTRAVIFAIFHIVVAALLFRAPPVRTIIMTDSTSWIKSRLTSLYEKSDAGFVDTFDQTFSPACEVRLNHEAHPLQTFKDDLASRLTAAKLVSIAWNESIISTNDDKPDQPAVVAGGLVITRSLPFRIRVGLAQRLTYINFSAKIEQDANAQGDDQRRITSFYYTSVDKTPPIHLPVPRSAQESKADDSQ